VHRNLRSTTRILLARAMLRVSEGDIEAASRDLLTCHRLARLATHRACVDEYRTALSIEMEIVAGEQVLLEEGLSVQQARSFLKELESLPDHQNVAETVNQGERLMSLDLIQRRWRNEKDPRLPESFPNLLPGLDINEALRQTHAYFDQQNLALNQTRLNERITKSKIAKDGLLITASRNLTDPQLIRNLFLRSRNSVSRSVAGFHLAINSLRIPSLQLASGVAETRLALIKIGFALAAYRAQSGEYPANLQSLSPNYLKFIPIDPFIEKPMHYRLLSKPHTHAQGYLLYSVGVDGTDDGGIAILDRRERDLILEVSHLFPPKP
jgi:hypothetical protein